MGVEDRLDVEVRRDQRPTPGRRMADGVPRTPETASPTTFRQWCEKVLKPALSH